MPERLPDCVFWVYELDPKARVRLHAQPVEVLAPRSVFVGGAQEGWVEEEIAPLGGTMKVAVPRRQGRPAREATLELRWLEVEIKPPAVALKKSWPWLPLYGVLAREVGASGEVEPIQWILLSTWPVKTLKMARRLVRWYALRWGIECWHKVLKVVCGVERRQMKSVVALERALALDMIVAWRVLLLTRLGKEHPELPAETFYTPEELKVLEVKKKK